MMPPIVSQSEPDTQHRLNKYGYNCIGKHLGMVVFTCGPLFVGAGSLRWNWAWIFTLLTFVAWLALTIVLVRFNPELLNERGKRVKQLTGTKRWDWLIMIAYSGLLILTPFMAGLDYRYGWGLQVGVSIRLIGLAILILSYVLLTWSMAVNRFFEATVRIQHNRGHHVISSGPYRYVRHPGYVAVILQFLALPLSLDSYLAWIPALSGIVLYIIRTALEDRTLQAELAGYTEYSHRVRHRLIPGVW